MTVRPMSLKCELGIEAVVESVSTKRCKRSLCNDMTLSSRIRDFANERHGWLLMACVLILVAPTAQSCDAHGGHLRADATKEANAVSSVHRAADAHQTEAELCCVNAEAREHHGVFNAAVVKIEPRPSSPDDASAVARDVLLGADASGTDRLHAYNVSPHVSALPVYLTTRRLRL